jgi:hypothetical protein
MAPRSSEVSLDADPATAPHAAAAATSSVVTDANPQTSAPDSTRNQANQPGTPAAVASSAQPTGAAQSPAEPTELLALVQSLQTLSPAEQNQLLQDLKQTDPKLWPLVTQQFKASLEYRKQHPNGALTPVATPATSSVASALPVHPTTAPAAIPTPPARPLAAPPASSASAAIVPAAATAVAPAAELAPSDWRQPLSSTIASVEQSLRESPGSDDRQIYLRLLHLIAGHRDQALELVAGREPAEQEFWSKELYALSTLWDASRQPDSGKRRTEAAIHFDEANGKLRELGLLTIRNLAFCTEVSSYGVYKRFEKDEFRPEQRVLVYAELENFVTQATPQGYHTALKASYQIFDGRGTKVEQQDLPPMEEFCQNPRRDFFVAYSDVRLPKQIYDGRYTLKLTIEDTLGKKIAQSSIEFTVKNQTASLATR